MASAVDGLVSGLDTTTLINQLLKLEARPQAALVTKLDRARSDAGYYRTVNTRFDALRAAAEAMNKTQSFTATKASSSAPSVAVSATPGAATASLAFAVDAVAARHVVLSAATWGTTGDAFGLAATIDLTRSDGTTANIPTTGTLADAVTAINSGNYGLSATAVQVSAGQYKLQISAKESGTAAQFTLAAGAETFSAIVNQAADAKVTVGTGSGKYSVTSGSNTFIGLMDGVTLTVGTADPATQVTVSVAKDPSAVAAKMKTLVDAANEALSTVASYTDVKNEKALLRGDATLRDLASAVLDAVSSAIGNLSAGTVGVQLTRTGTLTFDSAKFTAALTTDPTLVQKIVTGSAATAGADAILGTSDDVAAVPGIAGRLQAVAVRASDVEKGALTVLAKNKDASVTDLQASIAAWDVRLESRRASLNRTYTALETALGRLQNQSSWLASQLGSLPTWSSK